MTRIPYRTKDLNEAAFIWCQPDAKLESVEPFVKVANASRKPETFFFVFSLPGTEENLRELLFSYSNGETRVEPQLFVQKQANLRDHLFSVKRST